jgi:hypothetical protein
LLIKLAWLQNGFSKGWRCETSLSPMRDGFLYRYVVNGFLSFEVGFTGNGIAVRRFELPAMTGHGAENRERDEAGERLGIAVSIRSRHTDVCQARGELEERGNVYLRQNRSYISATAKNMKIRYTHSCGLTLRYLGAANWVIGRMLPRYQGVMDLWIVVPQEHLGAVMVNVGETTGLSQRSPPHSTFERLELN